MGSTWKMAILLARCTNPIKGSTESGAHGSPALSKVMTGSSVVPTEDKEAVTPPDAAVPIRLSTEVENVLDTLRPRERRVLHSASF
jgi:hypothetical protein